MGGLSGCCGGGGCLGVVVGVSGCCGGEGCLGVVGVRGVWVLWGWCVLGGVVGGRVFVGVGVQGGLRVCASGATSDESGILGVGVVVGGGGGG